MPLAPTGLAADATTGKVTWTDASLTEYKYQVTRTEVVAAGAVAGAPVVTPLLANTSSFADAPLVAGGNVLTYAYEVAAIGANGTGVASTTMPVTVAAPTGVAAVAASATTATVSWFDGSTNETRFLVEQSADGGTTWAVVATPASTTTVASGGSVSVVASGLTGGTTYLFRVTAQLVAGASTFQSASVQTSFTAPVPPAAPVLNPLVASLGSVALSWPAVTGATNYVVTYTRTGSGAGNGTFSLPATGLLNASVPVTAGGTYAFSVTAQTVIGATTLASAASNVLALAYTVPNVPVTAVPTTVRIGLTTNDTVTFTWTQPPVVNGLPVTSYSLQYSTTFGVTSTTPAVQPAAGATSIAYTLPRGTIGLTGYQFRIRATDLAGNSAYSAWSTRTLTK